MIVVGVWKPISHGVPTCVQSSVVDNEEFISLEISAYVCQTGYEITALVSAPTPSQALASETTGVFSSTSFGRPVS